MTDLIKRLVEFNIVAAEKNAKKAFESVSAELALAREERAKQTSMITTLEEIMTDDDALVAARTTPPLFLPKNLQKSLQSTKTTTDDVIRLKIKLYLQTLINKLNFVDKKIEILQKKYDSAQRVYMTFSSDVVGSVQPHEQEDLVDAEENLSGRQKATLDISQQPVLTWIEWPKNSLKIHYESNTSSGIGPGEARLAYVFGGKVQGSSVTYDIKIGATMLEVKQLNTPTDTIRAMAEGVEALDKSNKYLASAVQQLRSFVDTFYELKFDLVEEDSVKRSIAFVQDFLDSKQSKIVERGEFTQTDMFELVKAINLVRKIIIAKLAKQDTTEMQVKIAGKSIPVDRETYVGILKSLNKKKNIDMLKYVSKTDLLLSSVKDSYFKSSDDARDTFMQEYISSLDVMKVFGHVDYVVIVNEKLGFNLIPKDKYKDAIKFTSVSQSRPRFVFTYF